jgi:hypothetical protein
MKISSKVSIMLAAKGKNERGEYPPCPVIDVKRAS